jgi:hypothetical protein
MCFIRCKDKKEAIELVYSIVPQAMITIFDGSITSKYSELHEDNFEVEMNFA